MLQQQNLFLNGGCAVLFKKYIILQINNSDSMHNKGCILTVHYPVHYGTR